MHSNQNALALVDMFPGNTNNNTAPATSQFQPQNSTLYSNRNGSQNSEQAMYGQGTGNSSWNNQIQASDYSKYQGNDELGLVQARWIFMNKDGNLLTRLQNINLCIHFEVEQQVNQIFIKFFRFNGTAGVWRIKALEGSGGWLERTTVEDMDIAVRAHLNGWKFIYLNDVECQCELQESFEAYRKQKHRWHSGPMQLFRLCLPDIIKSKEVLPITEDMHEERL